MIITSDWFLQVVWQLAWTENAYVPLLWHADAFEFWHFNFG